MVTSSEYGIKSGKVRRERKGIMYQMDLIPPDPNLLKPLGRANPTKQQRRQYGIMPQRELL